MSLNGFAGAAGIKYGLNVRGPKKPAGALPRPTLAAFAPPSDDEADDDGGAGDARAAANAQIMRQQQRQRDSQKAQEVYAAALAQDASVFDYDGVYDSMKAAAQGPSAVERARGQSRYIGQLLVKAQEREREADVIFERRTVKEREKEDHLYGDKEKFVTAAYKEKLAADAAFAAEQARADAAEAAADVTKRRDLSAFYANLLTKNTAYGAKEGERPTAPAAAAAAAEPAVPSRAPVAAAAPAARAPAAAAVPPAAEEAAAAAAPPPPPAAPLPQETPAPAPLPERVGPRPVAPEAPAAEADAAAAAAAKRARASADAVASARERYLARKRARPDDAPDA